MNKKEGLLMHGNPEKDISENTWKALIDAAKAASQRAYAPYSKFAVGAAVLTESGESFSGCNVENASLGLTMCAERNAIFQAVASGHRKLKAVVIYTPTGTTTMPCGACRQVIREFGTSVEILSVCKSSQTNHTDIKRLLPDAFSPDSL